MPSQGTDRSSQPAGSGPGSRDQDLPPFEAPPFTDWREQLRERVKEIRARKLADKRRDGASGGDRIESTEATRAEKLRRARTEAEDAIGRDEPADLADPAESEVAVVAEEALERIRAETRALSTDNEEEGIAEPIELARDDAAASEVGIDDATADELEIEVDLEPEAGIRPEPPPRASVPLFQHEEAEELSEDLATAPEPLLAQASDAGPPSPWWLEEATEDDVYDDSEEGSGDDDDLEADLEDRDAAAASALEGPEVSPFAPDESEPVGEATASPRPGAEPPPRRRVTVRRSGGQSVPAWARPRAEQIEGQRSPEVAPPDLDAIPPELKDVAIPSWAIPRRDAREHPTSQAPALQANAVEEELDRVLESRLADSDAAEPSPPQELGEPPVAPGASAPRAGGRPGVLPWDDADDVEHGNDHGPGQAAEEWDPAMAIAPAPRSEPTRAPIDDVYLVGEFAGRGAGGRAAAGSPAQDAAGPPREIPNLHRFDDDLEVEPTPLRGLFEPPDEPEPPERSGITAPPREPAPAIQCDAAGEDLAGAPGATPDPSAPVADRVFSTLADALVVLGLGLALGIAGASAAGTGVVPLVQAAPIPFAAVVVVFAFAYGVFFVGTCGQTLGKMAMRVRVIGADSFEVGYAKAALRALWYAVTTLPAGVGLLPALRDRERRTLHDRLSGTRVVKA